MAKEKTEGAVNGQESLPMPDKADLAAPLPKAREEKGCSVAFCYCPRCNPR